MSSLSTPPASSDHDFRPGRRFGIVALVVLVLLAWYGAGDIGWIYDDHSNIVGEVPALEAVWGRGEFLEGTQRPLTRLTFALDHSMFGLEPRWFHRTNVALHAAAAILAFLVPLAAVRTLGRRGIRLGDGWTTFFTAWSIAAIWALLPVQTAAVSYVVQRAELLVAIFTFLGLLALLRAAASPRGAGWSILMVLAVAGALLSKPTAVFLPFLLLAADRTVCRGDWSTWWRRRGVAHIGSFLSLSLLALVGVTEALFASEEGVKGAGLGVAGVTFWGQIASLPGVVGAYARLVVDPSFMSIDHGPEAFASPSARITGWIVFAVTATAIVLGLRRRRWWVVLPIGAALSLGPVASVVPLADPVADYRAYLPTFFVVAGLVLLLVRGAAAVRHRARRLGAALPSLAGVALVLLVVFEIVGVRTRNRDYLDPAALWAQVVERRPDHWRSLANRAAVRMLEGRHEEAVADLVAAERLQPGNPTVQLNLAVVDVQAGRAVEALDRLRLVGLVRSDDPVFLATRGDARRAVGRFEGAEADYRRLVDLEPSDVRARLSWGGCLFDLVRLEEAAREFGIAASLSDDDAIVASGRYNEGNMYLRLERWSEAIDAYEAALAANPDHAGARRWLAAARSAGDG